MIRHSLRMQNKRSAKHSASERQCASVRLSAPQCASVRLSEDPTPVTQATQWRAASAASGGRSRRSLRMLAIRPLPLLLTATPPHCATRTSNTPPPCATCTLRVLLRVLLRVPLLYQLLFEGWGTTKVT